MSEEKEKLKREVNVSLFRIITGDDIIAESDFNPTSSDRIIVKRPMLLLVNIDIEKNSQSLIMYPWVPQGICTETDICLRTSDILFNANIEDDIYDYYLGMCFDTYNSKLSVISSSTRKASEIIADKGKNVYNFDLNHKPKKPS